MGKLLPEYKALFGKLNQVLNDWKGLSYKPNDVRIAENMLEQFYDWTGKDVKNPYRFNLRMKYTDDQQDELRDIALAIYDMDIYQTDLRKKFRRQRAKDSKQTFEGYVDDISKKFEKAHGKHGIQTFEEYVEFIDKKNRFMNMAFNSSALNYYQYEKLLNRAKSAKVTQDELDDMIYAQYQKNGATHDKLYKYIYKALKPSKKKGKK